jgi:hypothetical protein
LVAEILGSFDHGIVEGDELNMGVVQVIDNVTISVQLGYEKYHGPIYFFERLPGFVDHTLCFLKIGFVPCDGVQGWVIKYGLGKLKKVHIQHQIVFGFEHKEFGLTAELIYSKKHYALFFQSIYANS